MDMTDKPEGYTFGRPTKYHKDLPTELVDFFNVDLERDIYDEDADGNKTFRCTKPNRLPTVEGFCKKTMISKATFHAWVKKYPDFLNALGLCKQMQMNHLIQHTLENTYNPGFAKFLAINISDYSDKTEVETSNTIEINLPNGKLANL